MTKYEELLDTPEWGFRRNQILERDDHHCQECCSRDGTLHVHHRYYLKGKKPWDYPDEALVTLCEDCHKYTHEMIDEISEAMKQVNCFDLETITGYVQGVTFKHTGVFSSKNMRVIRGFCAAKRLSPHAIEDIMRRKGWTLRDTDLDETDTVKSIGEVIGSWQKGS